jgi:hypothetical protein
MARPKRQTGPAAGKWTYTIDENGVQLTAYERADRPGFPVYRRTYDTVRKKYIDKKPLCDSIRKADGSVDAELEIVAKAELLSVHKRLSKGLTGSDAKKDEQLTILSALAKVLHHEEGKYAGQTGYVSTMHTYRDLIVEILSPDADFPLNCDALEPAHYRKLWRALARRHLETGEGGPRACEMTVGFLQASIRWLKGELVLPSTTQEPAINWRATMYKEWAEITGTPVGKPSKPRYTLIENARLWEAAPGADPRIECTMELAAELRAGQMLERSRRSDIKPLGDEPLGILVVHGSGKKPGVEMVLSASQREYLRRAMGTGFLREVEAAYQAGELEDYYLIGSMDLIRRKNPDGTTQRVAQVKNAHKAMHKRNLNRLWKIFERQAGVQYLKGRAWYGMRRIMADIAEDQISDKRVLNRMGGWTRTETREGYQEEGRVALDVMTADARDIIRPGRAQEAPVAPEPAPELDPQVSGVLASLGALTEAQQRAVLAAMGAIGIKPANGGSSKEMEVAEPWGGQ